MAPSALPNSGKPLPVQSLLNDIVLKMPALSRDHWAIVDEQWLVINEVRCIPLGQLSSCLIEAATYLKGLDGEINTLRVCATNYLATNPGCEVGQRLMQATHINCAALFDKVMEMTAAWHPLKDRPLLEAICETTRVMHSLLALPSSIREAASQLNALLPKDSKSAFGVAITSLCQALEGLRAKREWDALCAPITISLSHIELLYAHLGSDSAPLFGGTLWYRNRLQHNATYQVGILLSKEGIGPAWKISETEILHERCESLESFKHILRLAQLFVELYDELATGTKGPQQRLRKLLTRLSGTTNTELIPERQRLFRIRDSIPSYLEDIKKIETQQILKMRFFGEDERTFASFITDTVHLLRASVRFFILVKHITSWQEVGRGIRAFIAQPYDSLELFRDVAFYSSTIKKVTAKHGLVNTRQSPRRIIDTLAKQLVDDAASLELLCNRIGFLPETTEKHYIPSRPD